MKIHASQIAGAAWAVFAIAAVTVWLAPGVLANRPGRQRDQFRRRRPVADDSGSRSTRDGAKLPRDRRTKCATRWSALSRRAK